jgi:hypothetical protein
MSKPKTQGERAEAQLRRVQDGRAAMMEHLTALQAVRDKTARLRALRLAREAADQPEPAVDSPPPRPEPARPRARRTTPR